MPEEPGTAPDEVVMPDIKQQIAAKLTELLNGNELLAELCAETLTGELGISRQTYTGNDLLKSWHAGYDQGLRTRGYKRKP